MRNLSLFLSIYLALFTYCSCSKDAGILPDIAFKTGAPYTSADVTVAGGTPMTIGVNASKSEDKDFLKHFNISKSVNGAVAVGVFDKELSGSEGDTFSFDYSLLADTAHGQNSKYIFTITNRDGLVNQVALTVTTQ